MPAKAKRAQKAVGEELEKFTFRLPRSLLNQLQAMADAERRKLSDYLRIVLEDHADRKAPGWRSVAAATVAKADPDEPDLDAALDAHLRASEEAENLHKKNRPGEPT